MTRNANDEASETTQGAGVNSGALPPVRIPASAYRNPHDAELTPSPVPLWAQRLGIGIFVALIAVTAFYFVTEHWRRGTFAVGVAMVWLAVLRLSCDSPVMGVLAVRSRRFDCLFSMTIGASILYLSASVDALSN